MLMVITGQFYGCTGYSQLILSDMDRFDKYVY